MAHQSSSSSSKTLVLKSSDGDDFEIEEIVAVQSGTIKNMVEDDYTLIPLPNVDTETLKKIIKYMKQHATTTGATEEEIKEFDTKFVDTKLQELFTIVFASNYLDIKPLLELLCQTIADRIKNKSVKAVRTIFNITNDYTPEEEQKVRDEAPWAHEGDFDETTE